MGRDEIGCVVGLTFLIIIIPLFMILISGNIVLNLNHEVILAIFSLIGVTLILWSVSYMKSVGGHVPFDILSFKIGHKTRFLITDGPYGLCRNPMMTGLIIYYLGIVIAFFTWILVAIFIFEMILIYYQIKSEEKVLIEYFGNQYIEYQCGTYNILMV